jgi:hypothetical protein
MIFNKSKRAEVNQEQQIFYEAGRQAQRQDILKMLDDLLITLDNKALHTDYGLADTLRSLVKGEQK